LSKSRGRANSDVGWADRSVLMEFNAKSTGPKRWRLFVMHDVYSASVMTLKGTASRRREDMMGSAWPDRP